MRFLWKPLRLLTELFTAESTPRQWAWGVALGMVAGLVPKDNLLAGALLVLIGCLRVNMAAVAASMFAFAVVGSHLDPLTHRVGEWLLRHESLQASWTWLANLPIVPWTNFHNTVVMGSFVCGLALLWPVAFVGERLARAWQPAIQRRLARWSVARWLWGAEWADRIVAGLR